MTNRKRCERCERPEALCYCQQIRTVDNLWPVHILQHPQESRHALGTARIAQLGLAKSSLTLWQRGGSRLFEYPPGDHREQSSLLQGDQAVLIYPGDGALPLSTLKGLPPRPLLFLDATWRKSRRMLFESRPLAALPRYALESPPPSRYRIRKEPAANALSTLEAIVYTLGLLEDAEERYQPLLQVMDTMIEQQIQHIGKDTFARNYGSSIQDTPENDSDNHH